MLSRAMAADRVDPDQERCVRMAAAGPSARAEAADAGGRPAVGGPSTHFSHVSELRGSPSCGSFTWRAR